MLVWLLIQIQGERGIFAHHFDGDFLNGSWAWSSVAGVARPRARSSFEATREVESNGGCSEAPHALWCRGGDCEAVCEWLGSGIVHSVGLSVFVAAASRRRVLHGGDPLGAVVSASFRSLSMFGHAEVFDEYKSVECGWVQSYCRLCCRL